MKVLIQILIAIILLNTNLVCFAREEKTNNVVVKYSLEKDYAYNFTNFNHSNDLMVNNINLEPSKDPNSNTWLWSFLLPGLGQFMIGEQGWGGFYLLTNVLFIIAEVFLTVALFSTGGSGDSVGAGLGIILFELLTLSLHVILYISNLLNAQELNKNLVSKSEVLKKDEPNNLLWATSVLFPGMGQILSGEIFRGVSFFVLEGILISSYMFFIVGKSGQFNDHFISTSIILGFHTWNIIDSYNVSKFKTNIKKEDKFSYISDLEKLLNKVAIKNNSIVFEQKF